MAVSASSTDAVVASRPVARVGFPNRGRGAESILGRVATMAALVDDADLSTISGACVEPVDRLIRRLQAWKLKAVAAADRERVATVTGASGTSAWLAEVTKDRGDTAAGQVKLATALDAGLTATNEALSGGEIGVEHTAVIASAMDRLPDDVTPTERVEVETFLVARAKDTDPGTLRRHARRALEALKRKHPDNVDAAEAAQLRSDEDRARLKARLTLHDNCDGTMSGHFTVPTLAGELLKKVVQQLSSPRRHSRAWRDLREIGVGAVDWPHQQGLAFIELLEHLPTDRLHGKVAATIVVTADAERLKKGIGAARTDTGADLSMREVRRLACSSGLLPAILDGHSHVLDLGRTERYFGEHQRTALATVYRSCAAFGCDRPYAWSDLHHENPWHRGGRSDLDNAIPLCGHHHRRIHDPAYQHEIRCLASGQKVALFHLRT